MARNVQIVRQDYTLNVSTPFIDGLAPIGDFSSVAEGFDLRISSNGSESLQFHITTDRATINDIVDWFNTLIGSDVKVEVGRTIWSGLITEMTLSVGGQAEKILLSDMANEVVAEYDGGETGIITDDPASNDSAITYGRKQARIDKTADLSFVDATRAAQQYVKLNAHPIPRTYAGSNRDRLQIKCTGYSYVLDWLPTTINAGTPVKDLIEQVITDTAQGMITFVPDDGTQGEGSIMDNGQTWQTTITGTGLELINKLTAMLDTSGNVWRFHIDENDIARWEPIDLNTYYVKRAGGSPATNGVFVGITGSSRLQNWEARAGVLMLNTSYPISQPLVGDWRPSRQHIYVETVRFDEQGIANFEAVDLFPETWLYSEENKP